MKVIKPIKKTTVSLNKQNRDFLASITDLGWQETMDASVKVQESITTPYRNMLLASLAGKTVTIKGHVINKTNEYNYTIGFVSIYIDGNYIDTVHHLNAYVDILSNKEIYINRSVTLPVEGDYDVDVLTKNLYENIRNNVSYNQCEAVEFTGIVFPYNDKWSIGTARQIEYTLNK
jgi:hypothetical protein